MNCCNGNYNLCLQQGATFERVFAWIADTCGCGTVGAEPQPVDLTGYSAAMQIRPFVLSTTILYDASSNITLGGTAGTVTLNIPSSSTEDFTWFSGVYDLLLTSPTGFVTRLLSGQVGVCPGVTAPATPQFVLLPGGQAANVPGGQGILTP